MTEEEIAQLMFLMNKVKKQSKDKEYYFDKPFADFLTVMSFLNPQSYGLRIQNRIAKELSWPSVKVSENKGDILCSKDNLNYEVKASLITESNRALNLVQIRLWQNVNYICMWFDTNTKNYSVYMLTHDQMVAECDALGSSAHGTKEANQSNVNKEIRFSLKIKEDDPTFKRWEETYKSNLLDFLFKV